MCANRRYIQPIYKLLSLQDQRPLIMPASTTFLHPTTSPSPPTPNPQTLRNTNLPLLLNSRARPRRTREIIPSPWACPRVSIRHIQRMRHTTQNDNDDPWPWECVQLDRVRVCERDVLLRQEGYD